MTAESPNLHELGTFYDERYERGYMEAVSKDWLRQVSDTLVEVSVPVKDLLDYGCGQGTWIPVLANRFSGARISGVDVSERAITMARDKFPAVDFRCFDGILAPYESESFDMIFCFHVLEHVVDLKATIADLSRLVRRNGVIVAILPCGNQGSLEERIVRQTQDGWEVSVEGSRRFFYEDAGHLRRLTTHELVKCFEEVGVSLSNAFYANQFWGGIARIARFGPRFIPYLCDYRRGRSMSARIRLLFLQALLVPIAFARRFHNIKRLHRILRRDVPLGKRLGLLLVVPVKIAASAVVLFFDAAAEVEWRRRRADPRGSAQYLILRRDF
jgi:SAM-dependent methyltransferase